LQIKYTDLVLFHPINLANYESKSKLSNSYQYLNDSYLWLKWLQWQKTVSISYQL